MDKNEIIKKVYYDPAGFGSIQTTLKDARAKDKAINRNDVKAWFKRNVERKTNLKAYNSFVANALFEEFQVDPCFSGDLKDKEFKGGLAIIDIFTKYATLIPTKDNKAPTFLEAF